MIESTQILGTLYMRYPTLDFHGYLKQGKITSMGHGLHMSSKKYW